MAGIATSSAASALGHISAHERHRADVVEAGALPAFVHLLRTSRGKVGEVGEELYAALALRRILESEAHRQQVVAAGAVEPLVALLEAGPGLAEGGRSRNQQGDTKWNAALSLRRILASERHTDMVVAAGAVPPLFKLLEEVQPSGAGTEGNRAVYNSHRKRCFVACLACIAATEHVEAVLEACPTLAPLVQCLDEDWGDDVKASAVEVIGYVFAAGRRKELVVSSGALRPLLAIIAENEDDEIRTASMSLIADLVEAHAGDEDEDDVLLELVEAGGLAKIEAFLSQSCDEEAVAKAQIALAALAGI